MDKCIDTPSPEDCAFGDPSLMGDTILLVTQDEFDLLRCPYFCATLLLNQICDPEDFGACIPYRLAGNAEVEASRKRRWPKYSLPVNTSEVIYDIEDM